MFIEFWVPLIDPVAGGPHLNDSTEAGAPYLDFEMWASGEARRTPSTRKPYFFSISSLRCLAHASAVLWFARTAFDLSTL